VKYRSQKRQNELALPEVEALATASVLSMDTSHHVYQGQSHSVQSGEALVVYFWSEEKRLKKIKYEGKSKIEGTLHTQI
jgi:hypothetical protein